VRTVDLLGPVDALILGQVGQADDGSAGHGRGELDTLAHRSGGSNASA